MEAASTDHQDLADPNVVALRLPSARLAAAVAETQSSVQEQLALKMQRRAAALSACAAPGWDFGWQSGAAVTPDDGCRSPLSLFAPFHGLEARHAEPETGEDEAAAWGLLGWRVFAARDFEEGSVVERCELLPVRRGEGLEDRSSCLAARYVLYRDRPPTDSSCRRRPAPETLMPLGYCPLYRRRAEGDASGEPELRARWSADGAALLLTARRALAAGEELRLPADLPGELGQPELLEMRRFGPPKGRGEDGLDEAELEEVFRSVCLSPSSLFSDLLPSDEQGPDAEAAAAHAAALEDAKEEALRRERDLAMRPVPGAPAGAVRGGWSPVHGRGVFALVDFRRGDLVELCPALRLDRASGEVLEAYCMNFRTPGTLPDEPEEDVCVLSLSCGSLFNHSMAPSLEWTYVPGLARWGFVAMSAVEDIRAGEELFICYGEGYFGDEEYLERDGSMRRRSEECKLAT
uniref:SET domain-containing protein n=1 Tax=Alexandrium monilatum TaxID=311494 RepID=A0A7S4RVG3_9DINO